ncbi:TraL conjugative transposon family protein [Muribaculum intestinale]|uniref:TraL conjugative transposon family protein n=1 Tax=Muribaculum intestinale TaxID=1796646 RepID=UPI00272E8AB6|nr:TraL conjugative transposon family protein [uncultured Muribaculum sp.]
MRVLSKVRDTIYNKVWHTPKGKLRNFLRCKCDNIPQKRRLTIVGVFFGLFVLIAFILFGNACYHIGLGQARQHIDEIKHIKAVELPASTEKQSLPTFDDI